MNQIKYVYRNTYTIAQCCVEKCFLSLRILQNRVTCFIFLGSILINRNRSSVFKFLTQREQQQQQHERAYKTLDKCLKHAKRFYFYAQNITNIDMIFTFLFRVCFTSKLALAFLCFLFVFSQFDFVFLFCCCFLFFAFVMEHRKLTRNNF